MSIYQEAMQQVLQLHLLPKLSVITLGRLACTSRQLRALIYYSPLTVWTAAARSMLPVACLLPHEYTRASLQAALRRYSAALKGLSTGQWQYSLSWSFPEPQFSACGRYLACFANSSVRLLDGHTGQPIAETHIAANMDGWLRFEWSSNDTRAGVVLKSKAGEPIAGIGDMLSTAVHQQGWAAMHQVPLPHQRWSWERFDGPSWSPDLTKLLASELTKVGGEPIATVVLEALSGAILWRTQQSMPAMPIWRPDGNALLYFAKVPGVQPERHAEQVLSIADGARLWASNRSAEDGHSETSNKHAFSPDGRLVCTSWPRKNAAVVVRVADGCQIQSLHGHHGNTLVASSLCWAPDGNRIAACFAAQNAAFPDRDAFLGVWLVGDGQLASIKLAQLVSSDPDVGITADPMMQWSPDALHMAVLCPTDTIQDRISIMSMSAMTVVCSLPAAAFDLGPKFLMFELSWSPDASAIVVSFVHENAMANGGADGAAENQQDFAGAVVSFVGGQVNL